MMLSSVDHRPICDDELRLLFCSINYLQNRVKTADSEL